MATKRDSSARSTEIREALVDLLADGGYQHASIRRLAEKAGIAVSAVYSYTNSKEDLVFDVIKELMNELLTETNLVLESLVDPADRLRAFIYRLARRTAEGWRESRILQRELRALSPERQEAIIALRDSYELMLREIMAELEPSLTPESAEVKYFALAVLGMCTSISDWYRPGGGTMSSDEIGDFYADLVMAMTTHSLRPGVAQGLSG